MARTGMSEHPTDFQGSIEDAITTAIKEKMDHFSADDYLIGVGDPTLIAAAACIAVRKTGGLLRMLKWDRMAKDYLMVELRV